MNMRRSDRQLADTDAVKVIDAASVLRIAFFDGVEPYLVPVNFVRNGLILYFHSAREGRKAALAASLPRICWEVEGIAKISLGDKPCDCSCFYESVIGWGRISPVDDRDEKIVALSALNRKFGASPGPFPEDALLRTAVFKIEIESFAGKANRGLYRTAASSSSDQR